MLFRPNPAAHGTRLACSCVPGQDSRELEIMVMALMRSCPICACARMSQEIHVSKGGTGAMIMILGAQFNLKIQSTLYKC